MKLTLEILNERLKAMNKALELQRPEYERRLDDLNHENERIKTVQKDSIPREVFDRTVASMNDKYESRVNETNNRFDRIVDDLRKDIKDLSDYKKQQEGKSKLTQYIPWLIAFAALLYDIFKK